MRRIQIVFTQNFFRFFFLLTSSLESSIVFCFVLLRLFRCIDSDYLLLFKGNRLGVLFQTILIFLSLFRSYHKKTRKSRNLFLKKKKKKLNSSYSNYVEFLFLCLFVVVMFNDIIIIRNSMLFVYSRKTLFF